MTTKKKIIIAGLLLIIVSITMGLLNFTKQKNNAGQFISESAFNHNRSNQLQMTPKTLDQLRKHNVTDDSELKLEYFFYTNTLEKAAKLAAELSNLNYQVEHRLAADSKTEYIITGWTIKMKMSDQVVGDWTKQMCELGFKFDCDFDGWGTQPE